MNIQFAVPNAAALPVSDYDEDYECQIDLTESRRSEECCVGGSYFGVIDMDKPLYFDDLYGLESDRLSRGFVYVNERGSRIVCRIESLNIESGEAWIKTSENPDKPAIRIYPDLIGSNRLYNYDGCLKSFKTFKHRGILFGTEVPGHMVGQKVMNPTEPGVFGSRFRPVALEISPGSFVLAALVDVDNSDRENPLIIRSSADYNVACLKMARNSSVYWLP